MFDLNGINVAVKFPKPIQNGCHFVDDIVNKFPQMKIIVFELIFSDYC